MQRTGKLKETMKTFGSVDSKRMLLAVMPYFGLLVSIVVFYIWSGGVLLQKQNLSNIINQAFTLLVVSIGATFLYAHGGMNMAYGACMVFSGMCAIYMAKWVGPWMMFPTAIVVGILLYVLNGLIVTSLNVPPFVASMCLKYICLGVVQTILSADGTVIPSSMYKYNAWAWKILAILIIAVIGHILLTYTPMGKGTKAIGANRVAVAQSGINVKKTIILAHVFTGICVGTVAFFTLCRNGCADSTSGIGLELNVMTAIVLGGLPLSGGSRAKISCAVVGSFTITILINGLIICGFSQAIAQGVQGIVFLICVYVSYVRNRDGLLL